ncbi:MAG: ATP-binding protein [Planctomycetota bacterium]
MDSTREKIALSWSSGKDSALSFYYLNLQGYRISCLLTTITIDYKRVSMHGVKEEIVDAQSASLGIPLKKVYIPKGCVNKVYEEMMEKVCLELKNEGIVKIAFGDIYLEDVRKYREENLKKINMYGLFPLWHKNSYFLAREFISLGFKAKLTCIDTKQLSRDFVGSEYDINFLENLPTSCDPCGENGEFHTLVYDGPIFKIALNITAGEKVLRDERFFYCDFLLNSNQ